jgi:hypothetical protein
MSLVLIYKKQNNIDEKKLRKKIYNITYNLNLNSYIKEKSLCEEFKYKDYINIYYEISIPLLFLFIYDTNKQYNILEDCKNKLINLFSLSNILFDIEIK